MNLSGNKNQLVGATKELSLRWTETKNHWHDAKCQEFDQRYMQDLVGHVDRAVVIIEKLDEILRKVQSSCE